MAFKSIAVKNLSDLSLLRDDVENLAEGLKSTDNFYKSNEDKFGVDTESALDELRNNAELLSQSSETLEAMKKAPSPNSLIHDLKDDSSEALEKSEYLEKFEKFLENEDVAAMLEPGWKEKKLEQHKETLEFIIRAARKIRDFAKQVTTAA